MKMQTEYSIKHFGIIFPILLIMLALIAGCTGLVHHPDPLAGWKPLFGRKYEKVDRAIRSDYRNYIENLSPEEKGSVGPIFLFEDGKGQHAVRITIGLHGTVWRHILIYDKDNTRIKTIKYASGNYGS